MVSMRGAWLIKPVAIDMPSSPWATGRPNGPLWLEEWSTCKRIEVAGKPGEQDDIGFGDGPVAGFPIRRRPPDH